MIQLVANPPAFDTKVITVVGLLAIGRINEDDSIWVNREDADNNLVMDSVKLVLRPEQRRAAACMSATYAAVTGTFHARRPTQTSFVGGTMDSVSEITGWSPFRQNCEEK